MAPLCVPEVVQVARRPHDHPIEAPNMPNAFHSPSILLQCAALALAVPALAQAPTGGPSPDARGTRTFPAPARPSMPRTLPMDSILWELEQSSTRSGADEQSEVRAAGMPTTLPGFVNVEVVGRPGAAPIAAELVASTGGFVDATWRHRASLQMPASRLSSLAARLPAGYRLEAVLPERRDLGSGCAANSCASGTASNESVILQQVGTQSYRNGGIDGSGVVVGIIDGSFDMLTEAQAAGQAPADGMLSTKNHVFGTALESNGVHGTACLETVFDHAPGAYYRIHRVGNLTHVGNAVEALIANGADVISMSLSYYNEGWADGTGDACAAALDAANSGILFVNSAGNRAETHWQGQHADSDGDGWLEFSGADETIDYTLPAGDSGNYHLSFDTSNGDCDYDLYLYDDSGGVLKSSTGGENNFEEFSYTNGGSSKKVHIAIRKVSGAATELELFYDGSETPFDEYVTEAGSTTSPSNTNHDNVVSCGAGRWCDWDEPSGVDGIVWCYSSRGPTNGGTKVPDLLGPTGNFTVAYNGGFGGTSCATPNVAGAAAVLLEAFPMMTATGIAHLLTELPPFVKDWGNPGKDYVYGAGGLYIHTFHADTLWIDRDFGPWIDSGLGMLAPFYSLEDALDYAEDGGRLVFFPGTYPDACLIEKALEIETLGTVTLGD
jgi:hypothetical protein